MKTILVIEDDININQMISDLLKLNDYIPLSALSPDEALKKLNNKVDLILLDLMLPKINGKELIRDLKQYRDIPVIIVSAISDVDMKVTLFELGADDYITKPFHNQELLSRIKLALKHHQKEESELTTYKDIILNDKEFQAKCQQQDLKLSKTEYDILKLLITHSHQVVTKTMFFEQVWDDYQSADENTLNVHISKIRSKLKKCNPDEEYIETIWKIGYKLK